MKAVTIDPLPQAFTANEQRVKALLDQGKTIFQIAYKLFISVEDVREMIFEIRKKECLMARKPKLSQEERAEIFRLYREENVTQRDLAARFGVSHGTIANIITSFGSVQEMCDTLTAADKPMPHTGINEEFEAAVDEMIAEREAADAEQKSAIAKPEKLPGVVRRALEVGYRDLAEKIEECRSEIEEQEALIAEYEKDIEALKKWARERA